MDLNRVFGSNEGGYDHRSAPLPPLTHAFRHAGEAVVSLQHEAANYLRAESALLEQIKALSRAVDAVHSHYSAVVAERDQYQEMLQAAEGRLGEVQRVVQRYTIVQEPVVASDGFTYERRIIKSYLDECQRSGVSPISQQTQSELTSTLVPNQSLKKLVDLLKAAKPGSQDAASASPTNATATTDAAAPPPPRESAFGGRNEGRLHPCVRVYGYCNYKDTCTYAQYPYDACLSHLKGKCRFGSQCHELHVDFRGHTGVPQSGPRKKPDA